MPNKKEVSAHETPREEPPLYTNVFAPLDDAIFPSEHQDKFENNKQRFTSSGSGFSASDWSIPMPVSIGEPKPAWKLLLDFLAIVDEVNEADTITYVNSTYEQHSTSKQESTSFKEN
jgi:hypothetical protein